MPGVPCWPCVAFEVTVGAIYVAFVALVIFAAFTLLCGAVGAILVVGMLVYDYFYPPPPQVPYDPNPAPRVCEIVH